MKIKTPVAEAHDITPFIQNESYTHHSQSQSYLLGISLITDLNVSRIMHIWNSSLKHEQIFDGSQNSEAQVLTESRST